MFVPVRRFGAVVLGVLVVCGPLSTQVYGQFVRPFAHPFIPQRPFVRPQFGLGVNPFQAQLALNTIVMGQAVRNAQLQAALGGPVLGQAMQNAAINQGTFAANATLFAGNNPFLATIRSWPAIRSWPVIRSWEADSEVFRPSLPWATPPWPPPLGAWAAATAPCWRTPAAASAATAATA
jgi:hypothetical protein